MATNSRLQVYRRSDGTTWGWRLIASNGNVIATDGGQGYENRVTAGSMGVAVRDGMYADGTIEYVDE